jgi:hypothetical protein
VKADHSGIETTNVKLPINPFDEIALGEAVRLNEAGIVSGPRSGLIQGPHTQNQRGPPRAALLFAVEQALSYELCVAIPAARNITVMK